MVAILIRFLLAIVVGVEVVKTDCGAIKVTVKGTNVDPTAIREKLEKKLKKKKVELVSPQPKKEGGGGGSGGNKKPEEKKPEKKEEPKKPKELRDELHKETPKLARENLESEPPIMEHRNQKEGEKNGGDNKVALAEKKDDISVTAVYKINCNCNGCVEIIDKALRHFDGVEVVKTDCGAIKVTVKGTNVDPTAIREKLEKKLKKKKVELVSPQPKKEGGGGGGNKKPEEKKPEKKEESKKLKELRDELHKETLQLARENLENEPPIMEHRNQPCPQDGS
nr:heavy metal-associated isoprenylated plant protein 3-like [Quercus suber]